MPADPQIVRQWLLLKTLAARHYGAAVRELAEELDVAEKTIRRDIDTLRGVGFPLEETVVEREVLDTPNTRRIKGHTLKLMRKWRIRPEWVAFDRAIGGVIADELREEGRDVHDVGFGRKPFEPDKYASMRVELYGELARAMRKMVDDDGKPTAKIKLLLDTPVHEWPKSWRCVALPPDALLREELFILPQCEDGKGRLCLPPKSRGSKNGLGGETLKDMLGRSPDRSDAAVLAKYAFDRGEEYRDLSGCRGRWYISDFRETPPRGSHT